MDIRVGPSILLESLGTVGPIDPYNQESIASMFGEEKLLPYHLFPRERALLCADEETIVPLGQVGFVQLRSTWARLGLISPPTIADPGFHGVLTMEVFNGSRHAIVIRPGDAIWSVHFINCDDPLYSGRYQGQQGITTPKALSNRQPLESAD